jgi:hypothetical protein
MIADFGLSQSLGVPGAPLAIFVGEGTYQEKHHLNLKAVGLFQLVSNQNDSYNVDKKVPLP